MTTEFKAVTPERAVQIMRAWAFHSWPMSVQDGIDVYTSFGFSPHPQEPQLFTSDTSPDEADSFFSVHASLSNIIPKALGAAFRSQVRATYAGFVAASTGVLGAPGRASSIGGSATTQKGRRM